MTIAWLLLLPLAASPVSPEVEATVEETPEAIEAPLEAVDPGEIEALPESPELEALRAQEEAALDTELSAADALLFSTGQLGLSNPLRLRLMDLMEEDEFAPRQRLGELGRVENLAALDLATLKQRFDIPIALEPMVAQYLRFFTTSGRRWFITWLNRSSRFVPMMQNILESRGMPRDTVYLAMIESGFSTQAYSRARASGPWQFISATGSRYGLKQDFWVDERRDPVKSTHAAARYLSDLHAKFGDWFLAWASYNAGDGKVRRVMAKKSTDNFWTLADGKGLAKETKHYVPKLIACAILAKNYRAFGFRDEELEFQSPIEHDEVSLVDPTDLDVVARAAEVSVDEIKALNPELRRWCTPPATEEAPYRLKLPKGTAEKFTLAYAQVPRNQRLTYRVHTVKSGDTLSQIARKYSSAPEAIIRMNSLKNLRALRLGSELVIPIPTDIAPATVAQVPPHVPVQARRPAVRVERPEQETPTAPTVARASAASVPGKTQVTYDVKSGDSLWAIGQKFGVSVSDLRRWNVLARAKRSLRPGSVLVIWR